MFMLKHFASKNKRNLTVSGVLCPRSITPNLDSLSEYTGWKAAHGRIPKKTTERKKPYRRGSTSMTILWPIYSGIL